MKKLTSLLIVFFISFAAFAAMASNKIEGMWKWSNPPFDYPVFIEFKSDGNMDIQKMKPSGLDVDKYKWNLDGSTIYYTRPAADKKVVNTLKIIKNDGSTMILRDSDGDMWLEKIR